MLKSLPFSKRENILVQEFKNEVLIFDLTTNRAYCLNETLAKIWQHCDGVTTFEQLEKKFNFTGELITLALAELRKENLLKEKIRSADLTELSRRELTRRVGYSTACALPLILAVTAPEAAHAASGGVAPGSRGYGQSCAAAPECGGAAPYCVNNTCCRQVAGSQPSGYVIGNYPNYGTCDPIPAACNSNSLRAGCCSYSVGFGSCTPGTLVIVGGQPIVNPGTVQCVCS